VETSYNSLISRILARGSKKYNDLIKLSNKLDDLYGGIFITELDKYGYNDAFNIKLQLVKDSISGENLLFEGLHFLKDVIFNPDIENNEFNIEVFEQEKNMLIDEILSRDTDKMTYSIEKGLEVLLGDDEYGVYSLGDLETIKNITREKLYIHYKNLIDNSIVKVYISGEIDGLNYKEIAQILDFNQGNEVINNFRKFDFKDDLIEVTEIQNLFQAKVVLCYDTEIDNKSSMYDSLVVMSNILGGNANSKLFMNVREKRSLCYYVFTKVEKYIPVMMLSSGIDYNKYNEFLEESNRQIEDMKLGNFSEEEISISKKNIVNSILSVYDSQSAYLNVLFSRELSNKSLILEDVIKDIMNVTKEDIIKASKLLKLKSSYVLRGEDD
jgi:predicted Zn-dependent peptidase